MIVDYTSAYEAISADIAYNSTFSSAALAVSQLITDIQAENESIQAGITAITTNMPALVDNLIGNIAICKNSFLATFLTADDLVLYNTGDLTIDQVVSLNLWIYYNALQQLLLYAEGMNGIITAIPVIETIRFYSNSNDYTLTEEEFDDSENSNEIDNTSSFYYYTVIDGDTSRIIALRELGDQELFVQILRLNNLDENDFFDGSLVGEQIKIPQTATSISNGDENLVYESNTDDTSAFLFGTDLNLNSDGEFIVSGTGDLSSLTGLDNAYQAIVQRLSGKKGSLNIFNDNWGTTPFDDDNVPLLVKMDRFIEDQVNQITADPRVKSASVDYNNLRWNGETFQVPTKIYFVGTDESREVVING